MTAIPLVQGRCPACGWSSLFLGAGSYITCSRADCPAPEAASTLLEHAHEGGQWRVEFYDGGVWLPCSPPFDTYVAAVSHQQHLDAELPTWRDESMVRRRTVRCPGRDQHYEAVAASTLSERRRVPCSSATLRRLPHQPHDWEPQPGMEPVHCPGYLAA